jgi:hypothetical protein
VFSGTNPLTIAQSLTNATVQASPTGTTFSTTNVMMGIGSSCKITPVYSGRVKLEIFGLATHSVATAIDDVSNPLNSASISTQAGYTPAN